MSKSDSGGARPEATPVTRRRLLRLLGIAGGTAALGVGAALLRRNTPRGSTTCADVPVRNPAYQPAPAEQDGHVVLYCQPAAGQYVAYDLNAAGHLVWQRCTDHFDFVHGARKTAEQIAGEVADHMDPRTALEFIAAMQSSGIVYFGTPSSRAYFVREEAV